MEAAISNLPNTKHMLCLWHVLHDLIKFATGFLSNGKEFFNQFQKLFYISNIEEWEIVWRKLFGLINENEKVTKYMRNRLYSRKEKWGGPWTKSILNLGLRSTQRVEVTNRVVKLYVSSKTTIEDLIEKIEKVVDIQVIRYFSFDFFFFFF